MNKPKSTAARKPVTRSSVHKDRSPGKIREVKYYGTAACQALWQQRPHDVIRIYIEEGRVPLFSAMLKWAAAQRKAYHIVTAQDLEKVTESVHHQGICILARARATVLFADLIRNVRQKKRPQLLVYLDGVENPHNLGAILRTCAHFGVRHVLGPALRLPQLSPSACRVAEGGAEYVDLVYLDDPVKQLHELKRSGFSVIATSVAHGASVYNCSFSANVVLVLGSEVEGISAQLLHEADARLQIPGSGDVESLNVSVACAVLISEFYRQHQVRLK
ncbi:MAG: hypothetical protein A2V90_04195 [Gammaproteobacteria bacterium RBG_16_57_12]|nr:MAG: hypothetical protein A2V90_04195 [Gammaproteobacteria bacterium RBG_16_57_12]